MKSRKNNILSLLIVVAMASIGTSATETFAVNIPVNTKARLVHPALATPVTVTGTANIQVSGTTVNPGTFNLSGPLGAKVLIDWSPGTIMAKGRFNVRGTARAEFVDPATGLIVYVSFEVVTKGRTNSVSRALGRFREYATSIPGSRLRGKYHH